MFIVVFQVYVNYFILKFNYNEFDEKSFFEVIGNWINFRLRGFLYQGTLWQKIQAAVSYKLVSYMQVLLYASPFYAEVFQIDSCESFFTVKSRKGG